MILLNGKPLELPDDNLYVNGRVVYYAADAQEALERVPLSLPPNDRDRYHVVRAFDRIDRVAELYYAAFAPRPWQYWFLIADANGIENPLDLPALVGKEIRIPDFATAILELTNSTQ